MSAHDDVGNRGTVIEQGTTLLIDAKGPEVTALTLNPGEPLKVDKQNGLPVEVVLRLDDEVKPGEMPTLVPLIDNVEVAGFEGGIILVRDAQSTQGSPLWVGSFALPARTTAATPRWKTCVSAIRRRTTWTISAARSVCRTISRSTRVACRRWIFHGTSRPSLSKSICSGTFTGAMREIPAPRFDFTTGGAAAVLPAASAMAVLLGPGVRLVSAGRRRARTFAIDSAGAHDRSTVRRAHPSTHRGRYAMRLKGKQLIHSLLLPFVASSRAYGCSVNY
ncbi:hypothetical protein [Microbulbifer sp.]|uniref:hypothetical protein n=1 Tax=Microbulbifer sp. TaxID=1908541 RepID=UPI003F2C0B58